MTFKTKLTYLFLTLLTVLFIVGPKFAEAKEKEWRVTTSGELPVKLIFAKDNIKTERKEEIPVARKKTNCGGGGLIGAVDCVAEKIEGAGSGGTSTGKKKYKTIVEYVNLRAELSGSVTPVVKLMKDGLSYKLSLDTTNMQRPPKLTGKFDRERQTQIVQDEMKVKKALRAWWKPITLKELNELKKEDDKSITFFFNEAFDGLVLLERDRPEVPQVIVYYSSSDCFELEVEFYKAQQDYQELMATIPFAQQFEVLTRSMAEIEDALSATAEGLKGFEGEMDKVFKESPVEAKIGEYIEETEGLSTKLTEALEGIQGTIKDEREAILKAGETYSKPLKEVKEAIGQSAETIEKAAATAKKVNKYLNIAKKALEADNMSGADTLRTFGTYFESVTEELGPLVKTIPVLGVFLDLYAQAIAQIAESVDKIEGVMHERNRLTKKLRDTGDPHMTPDIYKFTNTAEERLKQTRKKLFERTQTIKDRLIRECQVEVPWSEEYSYLDAIEDAGREAERACSDLKIDYKDRNAIHKELKKAWGEYNSERGELIKSGIKSKGQAKKIRAAYKRARSIHDYISRHPRPQERERRKIIKALDALNKHRGHLTRAEKSIWLALKSTRRGKSTLIKIKDIQTIEKDNKQVKKDLLAWYGSNKKITAAKKRLEKAKADKAALRDNNTKYKDCKKDHLRRLAKDKGWNMKTVEVINFDLFRDR
ncbi:MAG: hypothetical protein IME98_05255 [Proteobacteria bacterium]|nr:hypothetical protein [Pseudomonadota bacterium]